MKKQILREILDPVDYFHVMYDASGDEETLVSAEGKQESLSELSAFDEDNHFVKLGDFWPHSRPPVAA